MSKKRKAAAAVIVILIAFTLGFIWSNSILTAEASSVGSGRVYNAVKTVVDAIFGENTVPITHGLIRKLAHGTEFFVLGAEFCALFIAINKESFKNYARVLPYGVFVAAVDEGIQFINDRGPSFTDVLIDFGGFLFATALFVIVFIVRRRVKARKKEKTNG